MIVAVVVILVILLVAVLALAAYLFHRSLLLAETILKFEEIQQVQLEDYDAAIQALVDAEKRITNILTMPIFFESEGIRAVVESGLQEARIARMTVRSCAEQLIKRLQQNEFEVTDVYLSDEEDEEESADDIFDEIERPMTSKLDAALALPPDITKTHLDYLDRHRVPRRNF